MTRNPSFVERRATRAAELDRLERSAQGLAARVRPYVRAVGWLLIALLLAATAWLVLAQEAV